MPLEDLIDLGYEIHRAPPDVPAALDGVSGFGRQWNVLPGQDEEEVVKAATNHAKLFGKMTQAQAYFEENYSNWSSMTAQQKDAANRQAQRALSHVIRSIRNDLTTEGV